MNQLPIIFAALLIQFACHTTKKEEKYLQATDNQAIVNKTLPTPALQKDTLSLIGVGDIMLGTNFPSAAYLPADNGKNLLAPVNHILQDADITFGNLEGVVLNEGGAVKKCDNPSICYAFRMPEKLLDNLTTAGFDMLSIANNHVGDFGAEGRQNTVKALKERGFYAAGLESVPTVVLEKEGVKYGLAAFAPNSGTVDIRNLTAAKKIVAELAAQVDIVLVSFHGGAEGSSHQYVTRKTELFYGENRGNVYEFAHAVIDAGADVVFGHGPHVTRALEVYKNRFIAYSLGNFCTYSRFNLKGVNGLAPIVKIFIDREGKFLSGKITPIVQLGEGGVSLDESKKVIGVLQTLTKKDFPEGKLSISDDGIVK
jgi:poly-gamma-glutamate capsule biosynthesis protein CapA/YwtB (metallophosphatase superfamily)